MPESKLSFDAADVADTERLGAALAESLPERCVVALVGALGAGKTRLVQATAEAAGVAAGSVVSPTFVLIQEYHGRRSIYHFDAYRLKDDDEFLNLGPDEYFDSDGITFIEWADRVAHLLPQDRLEITIEPTGETERRITINGTSPRINELINRIRTACQF